MDQKLVETKPVPVTREMLASSLVLLLATWGFLQSEGEMLVLIILPMVVFYLAIIFLIIYLVRKRTNYLVYKDRVEMNVNWIRKGKSRMDAAKIESVAVSNSILGRDRYGRVVVTGSGGSKVTFQVVPNPEQFAEVVRSIMNDGKPTNVAKVAQSNSADDLASQLANLESLRAQGVLDDAEFKKAKAKLLKS